jgi:phosphonate degradation associated HDIG domain protein
MSNHINQIVDEVFDLYQRFGHEDYIGEPVSQLEHMSQSAELAIKEGYDDEVILAGFFHDIGHICVMKNNENDMGGFGVKSHERIGADYLRSKGFPERVARLVEYHVQAKRYLTFKYPEYYNSLSEASKQTLVFQGGVMTAAEASLFENDSLFEVSIRMRTWDELAKETDTAIMDIGILRSKAKQLLQLSAEHTS